MGKSMTKANRGGAPKGNRNAAKPEGRKRVIFHARINPTTAATIKAEAHRLGISQGELIDLWATTPGSGAGSESE